MFFDDQIIYFLEGIHFILIDLFQIIIQIWSNIDLKTGSPL